MCKKAFTLIELLVVIAIIAILAAILFPVFAQAKAAAKNTATLSNVKECNLGQIMYSGDYDDQVVLYQWPDSPWTGWGVLVQPYIKNVNVVFDPVRQDPWVPIDSAGNWGWNTTLAINVYNFANGSWAGDHTQTNIENMTDRIAFTVGGDPTAPGDWWRGWEQLHWFDAQRSACPDITQYKTANPYWAYQYDRIYQGAKDYHSGNVITAEGDGHAKSFPAARIMVVGEKDTWGNCENQHWAPYYYDASKPTNPMDQTLLKVWGKWWDASY